MKYASVVDYKSADNYLGKKSERPLAPNTRIVRSETDIFIRLYKTEIVRYKKNGDVVLNTDGYRTLTTRNRINEFTPFSVIQTNNIWHVKCDGSDWVGFKDGITYNHRSKAFEGIKPSAEIKSVKTLIRRINKYSHDFATEFINGNVPKPSGGDCWYCLMKDENNNTWGECSGSEHLLSHIEDKYYVPSLLVRALEKNNTFLMDMSDSERELMKNDVARYLRKYMREQLL